MLWKMNILFNKQYIILFDKQYIILFDKQYNKQYMLWKMNTVRRQEVLLPVNSNKQYIYIYACTEHIR